MLVGPAPRLGPRSPRGPRLQFAGAGYGLRAARPRAPFRTFCVASRPGRPRRRAGGGLWGCGPRCSRRTGGLRRPGASHRPAVPGGPRLQFARRQWGAAQFLRGLLRGRWLWDSNGAAPRAPPYLLRAFASRAPAAPRRRAGCGASVLGAPGGPMACAGPAPRVGPRSPAAHGSSSRAAARLARLAPRALAMGFERRGPARHSLPSAWLRVPGARGAAPEAGSRASALDAPIVEVPCVGPLSAVRVAFNPARFVHWPRSRLGGGLQGIDRGVRLVLRRPERSRINLESAREGGRFERGGSLRVNTGGPPGFRRGGGRPIAPSGGYVVGSLGGDGRPLPARGLRRKARPSMSVRFPGLAGGQVLLRRVF